MANTYKDIIITPNRNSNTAEPNISFRGGNTASNTEITLRVYPDSNGTLSFEGNAGQLFSITNDLTGVLFSVGDISGIPSAEIYANGIIRFAQYSGNVVIGNTTSINSALTVTGNLWVSTGINAATVNATTVNAQTYLTSTGANVFLTAINAANTVRVSQNNESILSGRQLNFVNTGTITVAVTDSGNGNANIAFTSVGGGSLSNIAISSNGTFAVNANAFNFINTSSVQVTVDPGVNGNANITFTSAAAGNTAIARQSFTGNGAQLIFPLSTTPEDENHTLVFVDAVYQGPDAYSINGNNLEFDTAPDNGANVEVYIYGSGSAGQVVITSDRFAGTGSCTAFTLSQTGSAIKTLVFLDGVAQRPTVDYQVSGTGLSFNVAPANATVIEARTFSNFNATDINVAPVSLASDRFTGTGSCTVFTLSQTGTTDGTFVFINGVSQKPGVDYSVANTALTLSRAPANGSIVEARTIGQFKVIETSSKVDSDTFTADGTTTAYSLSSPSTTTRVFVNIDGVAQKPFTDYVVTGNRLSFIQAPPSGTIIEARTFSPFVVAQETLKTLNIYARTGAVAIPLTGAGTLTVVGRSANTIIGVS